MGIEEREVETYETSEATVRKFMKEQLKIPEEEVKNIRLERVHRLGPRKGQNKEKPRPLVAKFASEKCKNQILGLSKRLKGTVLFEQSIPSGNSGKATKAHPNHERAQTKR